MFSVPYNLNSYDSYLGVGISSAYLNSSDGGVFQTFYYYSGSFHRSKAGKMAEYQSEKGMSPQLLVFFEIVTFCLSFLSLSLPVIVRGNMKPDTYKPTLSVQILPKSKEDQFVPGEKYSPRMEGSSATRPSDTIAALPTALAAMSFLKCKKF